MLHPTHLDPLCGPDDLDLPPAVNAVLPPPRTRAAAACQRWLVALGDALARAEKHITENFRVPPHGG